MKSKTKKSSAEDKRWYLCVLDCRLTYNLELSRKSDLCLPHMLQVHREIVKESG